MHELFATQQILETALQHAQAAGAGHIKALHLVVGQLSTMADDSVQFYWETISPGTLAEGACLHFRHVPATLMCLDCNHQCGPSQLEPACPACGSERLKIVTGEEFYLEAIDCE